MVISHLVHRCRPCSSSTTSMALRTSRSISCRSRRVARSSIFWLWALSHPDGVRMRTTSITFHARLPDHVGKGHQAFPHLVMTTSQLSSSLLRTRNCSCSSAITAGEGGEALRQSTNKGQRHNKEANPNEHRCRMKTHLAGNNA
jgi:hypothetical protein